MRRKKLLEIIKSLPWHDQLHIVLIAKFKNYCKLTPRDMVFPATLGIAVSMLVFLPSRNIFGYGIASFINVALAISPFLGASLTEDKRTQ